MNLSKYYISDSIKRTLLLSIGALTLASLNSCVSPEKIDADHPYTLRAVKENIAVVDARPTKNVPTDDLKTQARVSLCDRELGPSQIRVWEQPDQLKISQFKNIHDLTKEAPEYDTSANILGRTYSTLDAQFHLHWRFLKRPLEGFTCMKPSVDVTLKLSDLKVAVAKEFKPGSCSFQHILKHEYRHVAVNEQTLHDAALALTTELHEKFDHKIVFGTEAATKAELSNWFKTYWAGRVKELLKVGLAENKEIDSPEEYLANRSACDGELKGIVEAAKLAN